MTIFGQCHNVLNNKSISNSELKGQGWGGQGWGGQVVSFPLRAAL